MRRDLAHTPLRATTREQVVRRMRESSRVGKGVTIVQRCFRNRAPRAACVHINTGDPT